MKKTIAILFIAGALSFSMLAQPASPTTGQAQASSTQSLPADAASKDQLKKLFEVIGVQKQMQSIVSSMASSLEQMMPSAGQLSEKQKAEMTKLENEVFGKMLSTEFINNYLDVMVPVYQNHFNSSDVDQIIAFYSSPAGQKFVNEQPAIMQEVFPKVMPMMQQHMQDVMKETNFEQRMKAILNQDEKSEEKPK